MLRLLKERPDLTFSDLGAMLGCSERSLQRWWESYRSGGIDALLRTDGPQRGKPRRISDDTLASLQQKLEVDGFSELKDAQQWLQQEHGVSYSRSGLWNLLRRATNAAPRGWHLSTDADQPARTEPAFAVSGVSNQLIHFLNALPTSSDALEWGTHFREAIRGILGDVDRVSVNVNLDCDLTNPETYNVRFTMTQRIVDATVQEGTVALDRGEMTPSERILEDARRQGFPFESYHRPLGYDYFYAGTAYLGSIILWRNIEKADISDTSRHLMTALQPFMIFVLSDLVARHQAERPIDRVFHDALEFLVADAGLSPQEERIVVLQLMGHSYKEMADMLAVTVDTVKKHFKQIHRKTGTRGQAELFAKYFTSRLIPETFKDLQDVNR